MYQLIHMTKTLLQQLKKDVQRFPRLDTVLMVEETIQKHKSDLSVRQIWLKLPKKIMWKTYLTILNYLEYSGKILIKDKMVIWIWDPQGVREILSNPHLIVRK